MLFRSSLRTLSLNQLLDERYRKFRNIAQFYTSDSAGVQAPASTIA